MLDAPARERSAAPRVRSGARAPVGSAQHPVVALQRAAGNRATARLIQRERTLQRDTVDDTLQSFCHLVNFAVNSPVACARNPSNASCPSGFCAPFDSRAEAIGIRNVIRTPILEGIRRKVNPRVVPFWSDYLGSGFSVGGDASVRDITPSFGADFTASPTTARATRFLVSELVSDLTANRPTVPAGTTITVDIPTRVPAAVAAIDNPADRAHQMNFNVVNDIGGNLAGGIGKDEATCRVGAHPSPQADDRIASGTADVTGNADGSLTVQPHVHFVVHDTVDLCPGDCGTALEQCATGLLSRLEASGVSGDIPFLVNFDAPPQPAVTIPAVAPPVPTPPTPVPGQLNCPLFLQADGTPDPKLEACFEDRDRLRAGDSGQPVTMVQTALSRLGFSLGPHGIDGDFGSDTAAAVRAFKAAQHLGFSGIGDVGPGTMARLDALCPS